MSPATDEAADIGVLLTPRQIGGHELALFGWLADAAAAGLRPALFAADPSLAEAAAQHGLSRWLRPRDSGTGSRLDWLRWLHRWPATRPLLLAPGVLHAQAWLLAAALLLRHRVWLYVPMTHSAVRMGYSAAMWRDRVLAPWLRRVRAWIVIDTAQAQALRGVWGVTAPVHVLPNKARLCVGAPSAPTPAADGRLRVACVGRFDLRQKGLDWLADVLRGRPAWADAVLWRFQGRGAGELALQELASALGPHRATVCAHAPLDAALAVSDLLLLPSRYEGLPLVALEATERGWPVVASHESGLGALLPSASLFGFGDAAGLATALDGMRKPEVRQAAVLHARLRLQEAQRATPYAAALQQLVRALRRGTAA